MLGALSKLAVIAVAVAAGLSKLSFWWVLIPVFLAASFALANGPWYDRIVQANQEGRLTVFPVALGTQAVVQLALAAVVFGVTRVVT